jgi:glutathione S-transferase
MKPKLYVILGSHACRTGMLLLEHKGIDYERVELPTGLHPFLVRLRGFTRENAPPRSIGGRRPQMLATADRMGTVPALRMNGNHVETNREIARFLERLQPDPPLFPADPEARRAVEEAERWGDEVFQMTARRLVLAACLHPEVLVNRANDGRLGPLLWRSERMRLQGTKMIAQFVFRADRNAENALLASLPEQLDRIDNWVEAGVLDGEELNAADFMIAASLALLTYRRDLRAEIERRPAISLLDRTLPEPSSARAQAPEAIKEAR